MPNTYTWTCPRCGHRVTSGSPEAPANCPRCAYPDTSTISEEDRELEAEVGPEAALNMSEEEMASSGLQRGQTFSTGPTEPAKFDAGWLGEVMREVVYPHLMQVLPIDPDGPMPEDIDWGGMAGGVIERYYGERPTLICGCLAGKHLNTFGAMSIAHPDRVTTP